MTSMEKGQEICRLNHPLNPKSHRVIPNHSEGLRIGHFSTNSHYSRAETCEWIPALLFPSDKLERKGDTGNKKKKKNLETSKVTPLQRPKALKAQVGARGTFITRYVPCGSVSLTQSLRPLEVPIWRSACCAVI